MNAQRLGQILEAGLLAILYHGTVYITGIAYFKIMTQNTQVTILKISMKKTMCSGGPPLQNLHTLRQYLKTVYKPRNLEELKAGTKGFWISLTPDKCKCYINHLRKVM